MLLVTVLCGILYCRNQHEKVGGGSLECQIIQQHGDAMQGSATFEFNKLIMNSSMNWSDIGISLII